MVNRECISPRGPALRWGRVWPFGSSWVAPLVTLGDRPPQVEGNGGGLNYSAWTWAALGLLMSPDTLCESPPSPLPCTSALPVPVAPCASWATRAVQSHRTKKKTGDKKTPLSGVYVCACAKVREGFLSKSEGDFALFGVKVFFLSLL